MQKCFIFLMLSLLAGRQIASEEPANKNNIVLQHSPDTTVRLNWLTLDEAAAQLSKQKKPILVDLYTDWCGWCKVMDKNTYTNEQVIQYIQQNFYPVKLNAETRDTLRWRGKTFAYNPAYKVNEYAVLITQGKLSFPSTIILPADGSQPQAIPGYLRVNDMELVLKYFGEGHFGKAPFNEYQAAFKGKWK